MLPGSGEVLAQQWGGTQGLQLGSPPLTPASPLHHPTAAGGAGGAGGSPAGARGGGRGNWQGSNGRTSGLFLTAVLNVECHRC